MTFATKLAVKAQAGKKTVKETRESVKNKRRKAEKVDASTEASENDELAGSEVSSEARADTEDSMKNLNKRRKKDLAPFPKVTLSIFNFCSFTCNGYICQLTEGYD